MNLFRIMAVLLFACAFMSLSFANTEPVGFVDYDHAVANSTIEKSLITNSTKLRNGRVTKYTDNLFKNSLAHTKRQPKYAESLIIEKHNKNTSCESCHSTHDPGLYT